MGQSAQSKDRKERTKVKAKLTKNSLDFRVLDFSGVLSWNLCRTKALPSVRGLFLWPKQTIVEMEEED